MPATSHHDATAMAWPRPRPDGGAKRETKGTFSIFFSETEIEFFSFFYYLYNTENGAILKVGFRCQNDVVLALTRDPTRPPSGSAYFCGEGDISTLGPSTFTLWCNLIPFLFSILAANCASDSI